MPTAGELGLDRVLDRGHRRLAGRVDGLVQRHVPREDDVEGGRDRAVAERGAGEMSTTRPASRARRPSGVSVEEHDLARRALPAGGSPKYAGEHLDRATRSRTGRRGRSSPVDELRRVELVLVRLDEAAVAGVPVLEHGVPEREPSLLQRLDVAVVGAARVRRVEQPFGVVEGDRRPARVAPGPARRPGRGRSSTRRCGSGRPCPSRSGPGSSDVVVEGDLEACGRRGYRLLLDASAACAGASQLVLIVLDVPDRRPVDAAR